MGNVGIGSASPAQALDVNGTGAFDALVTNEDAGKRLILGRYSSSAAQAFSYLAPSPNSSGFKFNNAALSAELVTIFNNII